MKRYIYIILLIILSLSSIELIFRFALITQFNFKVKRWNHPYYQALGDGKIEYRLKPGQSAMQSISRSNLSQWSFTINTMGYRFNEYIQQEHAFQRVVILGDSYAFGWGVQDGESFPEQLAQLLATNQIHVANLGIPGYNTIQEYFLYDDEHQRFPADLVILTYVMNDAEPQLSVWRDPRIMFKYSRLWSFNLVLYLYNNLTNTSFFQPRVHIHSYDYKNGFAENSHKWRESRQAIYAISELCEQLGAHFLVAILPDFTQPFDSSYPYMYIHRSVREWCDIRNIDSLDLLPFFEGDDHDELMIRGEGHPNANAHTKMAAILYPEIIERLKHNNYE